MTGLLFDLAPVAVILAAFSALAVHCARRARSRTRYDLTALSMHSGRQQ